MLMVMTFLAALESPAKRGIGRLLEAAPDVAVGAKLRLTVEVPGSGLFVAVAAV
jgi:hypothetical protein